MKEGYTQFQNTMAPAAFATGADLALRNYDKYRRISFWIWFVLMFVAVFTDRLILAIFCAGLLHLHVLFNQLWWKLIHIEHRQKEKESENVRP